MREIFKNLSHFCYKTSFGTNWGRKTGIVEVFMHKYKCSFFTLKKIGDILWQI